MEQIRTKDLEEAAFLWCVKDMSFVKADKESRGGKRSSVYFVFEKGGLDQKDITSLRTSYYNQKSTVEPKQYAAKLVDIRTILREALKTQ